MELKHGKSPTQQRAWERVERVLHGAGQVFAEQGYAKATTNHIAKRAGVHVPSVYQYFENKDALLAELWDRHVGEVIGLLHEVITKNGGVSSPPARDTLVNITTRYVSAMLDLHASQPKFLAVLYAEAPRLKGVRNLREEATALLLPVLTHHQAQIRPCDLSCAAFVLATAVEGVARQAVLPGAPARAILTQELTTLVTSYLGIS